MNKRQHKHHIDVETDEPLVTVTIGSDGGVPGGFAKLFNRVVDSEAWAKLSDAGRAAYVPLVRFADHRNQFRVKIGRAGLMRYTGLSESSIKRAMKDLLAHRLIVLVEEGGVNENGENESNAYQLLLPQEGQRRMIGGSQQTPPGVQRRTPSTAVSEPPAGPIANPPSGRGRTHAEGQMAEARGVASGPQLRTNTDKENSKSASAPRIALDPVASSASLAAALLEEKGVEAAVARELAGAYPYERVVDVVAAMEWRKARGKCDNPGGFIREALVNQWQTPKAVLDARSRAEARIRTDAAERQGKAIAQREQSQVNEEETQIERRIASLDDDDLKVLAESVLEKYRGNAAVTSVLTRKPPRDCRLMKMEIAAILAAT